MDGDWSVSHGLLHTPSALSLYLRSVYTPSLAQPPSLSPPRSSAPLAHSAFWIRKGGKKPSTLSISGWIFCSQHSENLVWLKQLGAEEIRHTDLQYALPSSPEEQRMWSAEAPTIVYHVTCLSTLISKTVVRLGLIHNTSSSRHSNNYNRGPHWAGKSMEMSHQTGQADTTVMTFKQAGQQDLTSCG